MNTRQQLLDLYESKWETFSIQLDANNYKDNFAMPFLINVPDDVEDKFKIMIFGQETWGWYDGENLNGWIHNGMKGYKDFFLDRNFYQGYNKSSFWQAFRFYELHIPKILRSMNIDKEPLFIWNNISKLGLGNRGTGVNSTSRELERTYFDVIKNEFEIIKPDLVIFLTGPNRDEDILFNFRDAKITAASSLFTQRQMAKININGILGLRMYHPAYFNGFTTLYKNNSLEIINDLVL